MRIKMKETRRGSEDGFTVLEYTAGKEYELAPTERGEDLGKVFIREKWAEEVKSKPEPAAAEVGEPPGKVAAAASRKG